MVATRRSIQAVQDGNALVLRSKNNMGNPLGKRRKVGAGEVSLPVDRRKLPTGKGDVGRRPPTPLPATVPGPEEEKQAAAHSSADINASQQSLPQNVHKRFGSEESESVHGEEVPASLELPSADPSEEVVGDSDDEEPEVLKMNIVPTGETKSTTARTRKTKKELKPRLNEKTELGTAVESEAKIEAEPITQEHLPDFLPPELLSVAARRHLSIHEQPEDDRRAKKRKFLTRVQEEEPKHAIKQGVTYRTFLSSPTSSRGSRPRHQLPISRLPAKSNTTSRKLKEQLMDRKRVQITWGGRSSFVRT